MGNEKKLDIDKIRDASKIAIEDVVIGEVALRPAQRDSEEYKGLERSIEASGVLQPVLVRPYDKDHSKVLLVDGLQRVTIVRELYAKTDDKQFATIPVLLATMDEMEMLAAQIQTNLHKVKMRPAAFGQQIRRMMALNPLLTTTAIAKNLGTTTQWVTQRISLQHLVPEIASLVDEGGIPAMSAFALAKLPQEEQKNLAERAMSAEPAIFVKECETRGRELKEAARQGKDAKPAKFQSVPRVRPAGLIKKEFGDHEIRAALVTKNMSPGDAFDLAIAWVLHQDPDTQTMEKAEWEAAQEARVKREQERKNARAAEKAKVEATAAAAAAETAAAAATAN